MPGPQDPYPLHRVVHIAVIEAIRSGWAEAGICPRLFAHEAGLEFLEVRREDYDLCYPEELEGDPRLAAFVKAVRSRSHRDLLGELEGYECGLDGGDRKRFATGVKKAPMPASSRRRLAGALLLVLPLAGACREERSTSRRSRSSPRRARRMRWRKRRPLPEAQGIEVVVSSGASNTLATQIIEGAPADLFLSASTEWADSLRSKGLAIEARNLLGNSLVIAVPGGNPAGVKSPGDLAGEAVKKLALAGENVPAGKYAEQALRSAGLGEQLKTKIVRGQDVRMTLGFVERGEVEAGIVYATDVKLSRAVETAYRFDPGMHDPIVYRSSSCPGRRRTKTHAGSMLPPDGGSARGLRAAWIHLQD
jgi:molybdate transport system substrate-binding protein